jgi:hypothetical protein
MTFRQEIDVETRGPERRRQSAYAPDQGRGRQTSDERLQLQPHGPRVATGSQRAGQCTLVGREMPGARRIHDERAIGIAGSQKDHGRKASESGGLPEEIEDARHAHGNTRTPEHRHHPVAHAPDEEMRPFGEAGEIGRGGGTRLAAAPCRA